MFYLLYLVILIKLFWPISSSNFSNIYKYFIFLLYINQAIIKTIKAGDKKDKKPLTNILFKYLKVSENTFIRYQNHFLKKNICKKYIS